VAIGQQESGGTVIEGGSQPTIESVAALAISGRKSRSGRGVFRVRGVLPVFQVARIAGGRKTMEDPCGSLLMAIVALYSGVRAKQWEAILVIAHLLDGNIPSLKGVALRAIRPHLTTVNIRVAIRTILAHVGEHGFHMALHAFHFFMHAAQGIACLVVVKLGDRADGTPSAGGVAVLTRDVQLRAMGITGAFFLRRRG
jgi:hypothetical protein